MSFLPYNLMGMKKGGMCVKMPLYGEKKTVAAG